MTKNIKTTILMAVSADGFVARKNGSEDFLPHEGWLQMLKFIKKHGHLIWGRKTYEAVRDWGGNFTEDIKDVPIIIVSNKDNLTYPKNVSVCSSPLEAIEIVKKMGHKTAFLSGGPTLNTSFIEAGLVNKIVLNYNPTILTEGINLFSKSNFELQLEVVKVKSLTNNIIQVHYSVVEVSKSKSR